MSQAKRFLTDWRGSGRWSQADRSRPADYVSCWQTWTEQPIPGVPTLPVFSLTVYDATEYGFTEPWGDDVTDRNWLLRHADQTLCTVWAREDHTAQTIALDPTKRGFVAWLAPQIVERFKWAQGIHFDYYTDLAWLFPDIPLDYWTKYRAAMESLCAELRRLRPDWIILGQNYHFPEGIGGMVDGLYLEQTPTMFGMSLKDHAANIDGHQAVLRLSPTPRKSLWVAEIREPARIKALPGGETYLLNVKSWCEAKGVAISWDRDAAAGVGFPG